MVYATTAELARLPYDGLAEGFYLVGSGNTGVAASLATMGKRCIGFRIAEPAPPPFGGSGTMYPLLAALAPGLPILTAVAPAPAPPPSKYNRQVPVQKKKRNAVMRIRPHHFVSSDLDPTV